MRRTARSRGGKKATKASKAAAEKKKKRAGFGGMSAPRTTAEQRAVEAILNEKDPLKRYRMEQALAMSEAVRQEKIKGEAQALVDYNMSRKHPGERLGAGELVDLLMQGKQRNGG